LTMVLISVFCKFLFSFFNFELSLQLDMIKQEITAVIIANCILI
jgi:hypothetical protein